MDQFDDPLARYFMLRSAPECTPQDLEAYWVSLATTISAEAVAALRRVIDAYLFDDPEPPDLDSQPEPRRLLNDG